MLFELADRPGLHGSLEGNASFAAVEHVEVFPVMDALDVARLVDHALADEDVAGLAGLVLGDPRLLFL